MKEDYQDGGNIYTPYKNREGKATLQKEIHSGIANLGGDSSSFFNQFGYDGILGRETGSAVMAFQRLAKDRGLYEGEIDGIVGPKTIKALSTLTNKTSPDFNPSEVNRTIKTPTTNPFEELFNKFTPSQTVATKGPAKKVDPKVYEDLFNKFTPTTSLETFSGGNLPTAEVVGRNPKDYEDLFNQFTPTTSTETYSGGDLPTVEVTGRNPRDYEDFFNQNMPSTPTPIEEPVQTVERNPYVYEQTFNRFMPQIPSVSSNEEPVSSQTDLVVDVAKGLATFGELTPSKEPKIATTSKGTPYYEQALYVLSKEQLPLVQELANDCHQRAGGDCAGGVTRMFDSFLSQELNTSLYKIKDKGEKVLGPSVNKDQSIDAWDLGAYVLAAGGKKIYNRPERENKNERFDAYYYKNLEQMRNLPIGSIIGFGDVSTFATQAVQVKDPVNPSMGLGPTRHVGLIVGYHEKTDNPLIYSSGKIEEFAPGKFQWLNTTSHIIVPEEAANWKKEDSMVKVPKSRFVPPTSDKTTFSTFQNMAMAGDKRGLTMSDVTSSRKRSSAPNTEMNNFVEALNTNKKIWTHALGVSPDEYENLAKTSIGIAQVETRGGDLTIMRKDPIFKAPIVPAYALDKLGVGTTRGITQINTDIIKEHKFQVGLRKMGINPEKFSFNNSTHVAALTLLYLKDKKLTLDTKVPEENKKGLTQEQLMSYMWNNPSALLKGTVEGESIHSKKLTEEMSKIKINYADGGQLPQILGMASQFAPLLNLALPGVGTAVSGALSLGSGIASVAAPSQYQPIRQNENPYAMQTGGYLDSSPYFEETFANNYLLNLARGGKYYMQNGGDISQEEYLQQLIDFIGPKGENFHKLSKEQRQWYKDYYSDYEAKNSPTSYLPSFTVISNRPGSDKSETLRILSKMDSKDSEKLESVLGSTTKKEWEDNMKNYPGHAEYLKEKYGSDVTYESFMNEKTKQLGVYPYTQLWDKYGKFNIQELSRNRANYDYAKDLMGIPKPAHNSSEDFISELAHVYQFRKGDMQSLDSLHRHDYNKYGDAERYITPGTLEHQAHSIIEPILKNKYAGQTSGQLGFKIDYQEDKNMKKGGQYASGGVYPKQGDNQLSSDSFQVDYPGEQADAKSYGAFNFDKDEVVDIFNNFVYSDKPEYGIAGKSPAKLVEPIKKAKGKAEKTLQSSPYDVEAQNTVMIADELSAMLAAKQEETKQQMGTQQPNQQMNMQEGGPISKYLKGYSAPWEGFNVGEFQTLAGLKADNVYGPKTHEALLSDVGRKYAMSQGYIYDENYKQDPKTSPFLSMSGVSVPPRATPTSIGEVEQMDLSNTYRGLFRNTYPTRYNEFGELATLNPLLSMMHKRLGDPSVTNITPEGIPYLQRDRQLTDPDAAPSVANLNSIFGPTNPTTTTQGTDPKERDPFNRFSVGDYIQMGSLLPYAATLLGGPEREQALQQNQRQIDLDPIVANLTQGLTGQLQRQASSSYNIDRGFRQGAYSSYLDQVRQSSVDTSMRNRQLAAETDRFNIGQRAQTQQNNLMHRANYRNALRSLATSVTNLGAGLSDRETNIRGTKIVGSAFPDVNPFYMTELSKLFGQS